MRCRLLLNPSAGSGSATRRVPALLSALSRAGVAADVAQTRGPGDAARLVREAHAEQIQCVAVVGGDGTLNDACQAYLDGSGDAQPGPELALVPAGTGGDFRRTFGRGTSVQEAVDRIVNATPRPLDLGVVDLTTSEGTRIRRGFVNVMSFGIGGLTDRIVNAGPKWMGGGAAFFLGSLRALLVYRNLPVRITVDDEVWHEGPILNVAVANGRYFGGGMKIAPQADVGDGELDLVALEDLSKLQSLALSRHLYRGSHVHLPGVRFRRGRRITAEPLSKNPVAIDLDGETPGDLPLSARVLPGAIRLRV